jgi:hypothetical protein
MAALPSRDAALAAIFSLLGFLRVLPVPARTVEENKERTMRRRRLKALWKRLGQVLAKSF